MDCCICYETINHTGYNCFKCVDGKICDVCYFGKYLYGFVLIETENSMYKVVPCPVCRQIYKEEYVEN